MCLAHMLYAVPAFIGAGALLLIVIQSVRRIQYLRRYGTAWTATVSSGDHAPVRVLTHIKKLDDVFGQFLVRVICDCGAVREIEPEALARVVGWKVTLKELAPRMRCSRCGKKAAEVVAVARPRPRE